MKLNKKLKRIAAFVLTSAMVFSTCAVVRADEKDDAFWEWFMYNYLYGDNNGYGYDTAEYPTPVITSPRYYETKLSSDQITITWKYTGSAPCTVVVQDSAGNISQITGEAGNKAIILPNKLAKGGNYTITVKAGNTVSEPFNLHIADRKEEIVEIVGRTPVEKAEPRIEDSLVVPTGAFDTKEAADLHVTTVKVKVWQLNKNNQKVTATIPVVINAKLAPTVVKIFDEIYQNQIRFPIKYAGGYSYRTTAGGGRLSEHAYGTAIDINPDENYCVYSSGVTVGKLYEPYQNPYSVTPEIINIFRKYNFRWGGSYGDYMHFSYFGT